MMRFTALYPEWDITVMAFNNRGLVSCTSCVVSSCSPARYVAVVVVPKNCTGNIPQLFEGYERLEAVNAPVVNNDNSWWDWMRSRPDYLAIGFQPSKKGHADIDESDVISHKGHERRVCNNAGCAYAYAVDLDNCSIRRAGFTYGYYDVPETCQDIA